MPTQKHPAKVTSLRNAPIRRYAPGYYGLRITDSPLPTPDSRLSTRSPDTSDLTTLYVVANVAAQAVR